VGIRKRTFSSLRDTLDLQRQIGRKEKKTQKMKNFLQNPKLLVSILVKNHE
jgi:hypothetical protein